MPKVGSRANFGWGKYPGYAAHSALKNYYGGNEGTVAAHANRYKDFLRFIKEQGLSRDISKHPPGTLKAYAADVSRRLHNGEMKTSTAHNRISSVNMTFEAMTGKNPGLSPAEETGLSRSGIRLTEPTGLDKDKVQNVVNGLSESHPRTAAVITLERQFGLRAKEAALLNPKVALKDAQKYGRINVTEGTKGGRGEHVDRHVPIRTPEQLQALKDAASIQGRENNLIPPGKTWISFYNHNRHILNNHQSEIEKQHDLRAAYACERYQELTGYPAPVCRTNGDQGPDRAADKQAREQISYELGHSRIDVTNSYLGK